MIDRNADIEFGADGKFRVRSSDGEMIVVGQVGPPRAAVFEDFDPVKHDAFVCAELADGGYVNVRVAEITVDADGKVYALHVNRVDRVQLKTELSSASMQKAEERATRPIYPICAKAGFHCEECGHDFVEYALPTTTCPKCGNSGPCNFSY